MTSLRHRNAPHASPDPNAGGDLAQSSLASTLQMGSPSNNDETRASAVRASLMSGNRSNSLRNSWKFEGGGSPSPYYSKYNRQGGGFGGAAAGWRNVVALIVGFVLFVAPWTRYIQLHWTARTMQSNLEQLQTQQRKLQKELTAQTETLKKITADTARHKEENDVLLGNLKAFGDNFDDFDSAAYEAAEETEDAYLKRISELEKEIQRSSARQLVEHGYSLMGTAAPIRAVITLNENVGGMGNQIVLEMAPSHTYAHAISFFFTLVQKKRFFDGLTLMRTSGSSLVYTVPINFETKEMSADTMQHFEMSSNGVALDKLTVLEYPQAEEDYPIEKYSVLFADHGPHFFINMNDNIDETAVNKLEVCFAKVVEGQAVLDYFVDRQASGGLSSANMVGIKSIRMLEAIEEDKEASRWLPLNQRKIEYRVREDDM